MNYLKSLLSGLLLLGLLAAPVHAKDIEDASCFSETAASNTCASPDGWAANQAPSSIYANLKELMGGIKRAWDRDHATLSSTGSANAYVLTYSVAPTAYVNGQRYAFKSNFANTGSATVNVNALGAITIQKQTSSGLANLASGDIFSGQHATLEYDSGAGVFVLLNPQVGGAGGGGVSSVTCGTGLSGGTITGTGTCSVTAPVTVSLGGVGATTLSAHGVLLGNGTSAINAATPSTAGKVLTSNGASADPTFQTFTGASPFQTCVLLTSTASSPWSVPASASEVMATPQAGGGGGGGASMLSSNTGAAGGGAGQHVTALVAVSGTVAYSIGAAGSAGIGNGADGGNGGDTVFGTVTAKGGPGATSASNGTSSTPTANVIASLIPSSSASIIGVYVDQSSTNGSAGTGGLGGASPFGVGGARSGTGGNFNGNAPASGFGGGGSGASRTSNGNSNGGAGKIGAIQVCY